MALPLWAWCRNLDEVFQQSDAISRHEVDEWRVVRSCDVLALIFVGVRSLSQNISAEFIQKLKVCVQDHWWVDRFC
ncbi:hypothetical protein [Rubritalea tangerina]|uniref:hypothetical protein n=1 Tax=Rubritalea tangerina TaxID=430798 RepID=UPI00360641BD